MPLVHIRRCFHLVDPVRRLESRWSMVVEPLTDVGLSKIEDQYARGFIGGQWTHRVVPRLFDTIHALTAEHDRYRECAECTETCNYTERLVYGLERLEAEVASLTLACDDLDDDRIEWRAEVARLKTECDRWINIVEGMGWFELDADNARLTKELATATSAEPECPHLSHSGVDQTPVDDPAKVWRCDECGALAEEGS